MELFQLCHHFGIFFWTFIYWHNWQRNTLKENVKIYVENKTSFNRRTSKIITIWGLWYESVWWLSWITRHSHLSPCLLPFIDTLLCLCVNVGVMHSSYPAVHHALHLTKQSVNFHPLCLAAPPSGDDPLFPLLCWSPGLMRSRYLLCFRSALPPNMHPPVVHVNNKAGRCWRQIGPWSASKLRCYATSRARNLCWL